MKVYIQRQEKYGRCVFNSLDELRGSIEIEVEGFYGDSITDEQMNELVEKTAKAIDKLQIGDEIELFDFRWSVADMPIEEFENLEEFMGW